MVSPDNPLVHIYIINNIIMTKEEILQKAIREYPIGTIFKLAHHPLQKAIITSNNFIYGNNNNVYSVSKKGIQNIDYNKIMEDGCVYINGKWAKVISYHKDYNKLIKYY